MSEQGKTNSSMKGYIPVRTKNDSEDDYHSPYDTNDPDNLQEGHYEAPSYLRQNPSGSIFIPNSPSEHIPGESIRPGVYSPQPRESALPGVYTPPPRESTLPGVYSPPPRERALPGVYTPPPRENAQPGVYSAQHSLTSSSSNRPSENNAGYGVQNNENLYCNASMSGGSQYNVGTLGTRLGKPHLNRGGEETLARSPQNESYKNLNRTTLQSYSSSSGQLTGVFHPSSHPSQNLNVAASLKRPTSSSQSDSSHCQSFRLQSDISNRCSWKFVAIFFILFSSLLITTLLYTAASNYIIGNGVGQKTAKACAVVEDSRHNENTFDILDVEKNTVTPNNIAYTPRMGSTGWESPPPKGSTFKPLAMNEKQVTTISPFAYWNFHFHQKTSAYVAFSFTIPRGSFIGLYARKNAIPTITNYDLIDVLKGFHSPHAQSLLQQEIQSSVPSIMRKENYYLDMGHWFLSLYNDGGDPRPVEMTASVSHYLTSSCPKGCSGNGECVGGFCQCNTGFEGPDCSESTCPILCSNNGEYEDGRCRCYPGWKGPECSIGYDECLIADCNNYGNCVNGECVCLPGHTGEFCDKPDCLDPSCSGHGFCVAGKCLCRKGWKGQNCGVVDDELKQCLPDCSGNGVFVVETLKCVCHEGFVGDDCIKELCDRDCGDNGQCVSGSCECNEGWHGEECSVKDCDIRCSAHGMCSNGTCLCTNGWNGRHCTLEGCPGNCHGHGTCTTTYKMAWECLCETGWYGDGCDIELEQNCGDKTDNDKDGLVDCEDPECCENPICERSQLCHTVASPIDILLRKQPPAITASFYERMRFIIDDRGLQSYAKKKGFNESRAAVVRGQVVTPAGMGLIGVRVSTNGANEGFTMTRDDGWFDLMVNGGGPVMLQFGRNPYSPLRLSLYVPWNEVVVLSPVKLSSEEIDLQIPELYQSIDLCAAHDYTLMQPIALASWINNYQGAKVDSSAIIAETQVVQESLKILGSDIRLMYHSSRVKGYYSTIRLQLTPETISEKLIQVHLVISIEGVLEEKVFEADPNIRYTYAWDRLNVYRQQVYGITTATIKVGYEYTGCDIVWHVQSTKLAGHDMVLSDIAGWNLHVTHKYNFHEGILQKGDGTKIYLKYKPLLVTTVMGNGHQRKLVCPSSECNGPAVSKSLLSIKSLTNAPDGSLFVADHDLIRKISPDGLTTNLLKLNFTHVSYRYHLAHRTYTGELEQRQTVYVSLPGARKVINISSLDNPEPIESNWQDVIGNGERCLPGDEDDCGDGGRAVDARLTYPKGLAIGPEGKVYIADGNNIRVMDEYGIINTFIGHQNHRMTWKPLPCTGSPNRADVQLNWPTALAISPLDGTLHFIDDNMVIQITKDDRVRIVAGRPLNCNPSLYKPDSPNSATLNDPQSITFSQNGDIYIAESDGKRINRVRKITSNWKLETIAGKNSNCNCMDVSCQCFDSDIHLAAKTRFSAISSIAVTPDGKLFIADEGNYRIRLVSSMMPISEKDGVFEVPDTDSRELYIFNRFGQHILTKDIMTRQTLYKMDYSQSTSNGRLLSITDSSKRKLVIMRDYSSQITAIETSNGQKHSVKVNRMGYLESFERPDKYRIEFRYISASGLLLSKLDSQNLGYVFQYDEYGRLIQAVSPTGEITSLIFNLTSSGGNIIIDNSVLSVTNNRVMDMSEEGKITTETIVKPDNTLVVLSGTNQKETLSTIPHPVISHGKPIIGDSYPMVGEIRVELGDNLISKIEWQYNLQTSGHDNQMLGISKKLRINGENILVVSYDKLQSREVLLAADQTEILEIKYDEESRPMTWVALGQSSWAPVSHRYDRFGRLIDWKWGNVQEIYKYEKNGRLDSIKKGNHTILTYEYRDTGREPFKVVTGSQGTYLIDYDIKSGSVKSIATPRGHIHSWNIQPDIGRLIWSYISPWSSKPYIVIYNAEGDILFTRLPSGNEQVSYIYGPSGELHKVFAGLTEMEFSRDQESGRIESIFVTRGDFKMREKRKYQSGLLKEQKIRFAGVSGLDNANIKYQLDGSGRPSRVNANFGKKEAPSCTWKYNQNTGLLESVSDLNIRKITYNKTEVEDTNGNFLKTIELDRYGNLKSIICSISRRKIFSMDLEYNVENKLQRQTVIDHEGQTSEDRFLYSPDGHLIKTWGPTNYGYKYDENGNLIEIDQGSQTISITYGPGDRVNGFGKQKISYDTNGFVASVDKKKFLYNALGQLVEHVTDKAVKVQYYYDQLSRLIAWTDSHGLITQYFYTNPIQPQQVTYVHNPQNDLTQKLTYDSNHHLIMIETHDQTLYVATDHLGSPVIVFDENGNVMKQIRYAPFGDVLDDTQPNMQIPIGFRGGISSIHSTFLYMDGRIYESSIAQWLSPDWLSLQEGLETPLDLFIYRFSNNDPVNYAGSTVYMTSINDWAKLYGFHTSKMFRSTSLEKLDPIPEHRVRGTILFTSNKVISELDISVEQAKNSLYDLRFVRTSDDVINPRRINLIPRFASIESNFGKGFLLSVIKDKRAVVRPVEVHNSVVQKIFESVLNNSIYLEVSYSSPSKSVYYFVKQNMNLFSVDSDTVRRLAGVFTISPKDIDEGKELSIINSEFEVRILYGNLPRVYQSDILKTSIGHAVNTAWIREKSIVARGFSGNGNWSPNEMAELLRAPHARVSGYDAVEIQPVAKFPHLARDGTNFKFVRAGQKKSKNRHGRLKHVH